MRDCESRVGGGSRGYGARHFARTRVDRLRCEMGENHSSPMAGISRDGGGVLDAGVQDPGKKEERVRRSPRVWSRAKLRPSRQFGAIHSCGMAENSRAGGNGETWLLLDVSMALHLPEYEMGAENISQRAADCRLFGIGTRGTPLDWLPCENCES